MSLAKERWRTLRSVFLEKNSNDRYKLAQPNSASVRRFASFDLFTSVIVTSSDKDREDTLAGTAIEWTQYIHRDSLAVEIALLPQTFSVQDLQGFNNTGNVCIWPSEEVMAFYCLQNIKQFVNMSVCELGAGMTGLAGILLAKTGLPSELVITDGNERSVDNLQSIIKHNQLNKNMVVTAEVIIWEDTVINSMYGHLKERFDVIICADCLFFTETHNALISLLLHMIKSTGVIYMFAPERNGTMQIFCNLARMHFHVDVSTNYLDNVWEKHVAINGKLEDYNPDIHYPKLISMKMKE